MNIIAVDDEASARQALERSILMAQPDATVACFKLPEQALRYARENRIDAAFLDIEMAGMNGLSLAKCLKEICRSINIIFVTGFRQYTGEALDLRVSGYVMKPINPDRVREELNNLRYPPEDAAKPKQIDRLGGYTFDHTFKRVFFGGRDIMLQPREYNIFHQLASRPGVYVTARELYEKAVGQGSSEDIRTLYSHVSRLRKKLESDGSGTESEVEIEQRRGKGYRLVIHFDERDEVE